MNVLVCVDATIPSKRQVDMFVILVWQELVGVRNKMPKIRIRSSKPNHAGGYSQGRKLEKERNHTHQNKTVTKLNGQPVIICTTPKCKQRSLST